jgi:hypothetical protein
VVERSLVKFVSFRFRELKVGSMRMGIHWTASFAGEAAARRRTALRMFT